MKTTLGEQKCQGPVHISDPKCETVPDTFSGSLFGLEVERVLVPLQPVPDPLPEEAQDRPLTPGRRGRFAHAGTVPQTATRGQPGSNRSPGGPRRSALR